MPTQISAANIEASTLSTLGAPKIANIQVANSSYSATGANTVSTSGGFVIINGTGFTSNVNVVIGNRLATAVSYVNPNRLNVQVPALTANSYIVYVTLTDTGRVAMRPNGITTA